MYSWRGSEPKVSLKMGAERTRKLADGSNMGDFKVRKGVDLRNFSTERGSCTRWMEMLRTPEGAEAVLAGNCYGGSSTAKQRRGVERSTGFFLCDLRLVFGIELGESFV